MEPASYTNVLTNRTLKRLFVGFGSQRKNDALRNLARQAGIDSSAIGKFVFR